MEIYQVEWQPQSIIDLKEIRAYLEEQDASTAIVEKIFDQANELFYFPARCRKISSKSDKRILVVKEYSVFYRIIEGRKLVQIMFVWHHSRDISELDT